MSLEAMETSLPGVWVFKPRVFGDSRGFFLETFHAEKYRDFGLDKPFLQDNHSHSARGVLRGLHYQLKQPQGKLVSVLRGEIFDVAVDIRKGSPTFGQWAGARLSGENHHQIYIPEGFAHGFCVLSESADVYYKCTALYRPGDEFGILWSDAEIGIDWPLPGQPLLSEKDLANPRLAEAPPGNLPPFFTDPTS